MSYIILCGRQLSQAAWLHSGTTCLNSPKKFWTRRESMAAAPESVCDDRVPERLIAAHGLEYIGHPVH